VSTVKEVDESVVAESSRSKEVSSVSKIMVLDSSVVSFVVLFTLSELGLVPFSLLKWKNI